ncbi:CPBP family intramembrane glutamic endopeptidase [Salinibacterium soli]|uniref:CPBP family intramembrane metalloprotease n=1 Tax=Antiquaquibacter soli TaxID=3064523 RepID=A0ABT9BQH6_9MICO|nr:CPBP family intramembrane glutamic endopeptidase [Protaetiibacter sp. WY-16]MDO7883273.1 CPBP family intramembrane metalloprotease [Protaetiibacter sp. WY-16]
MLDPSWPWTPLVAWVLLAALLALLVVRTALKDRREYRRFTRYRTTLKRQAMMRKWLLDSLWSIGGVAVVVLVVAGRFVAPLLAELQSWLPIDPGLVWGIISGGAVALAVLTIVGIHSARHSPDDVATIGDIAAMLPRNRQELRLGWLLSINAGVSEELLFRLALPALVFAATGSAAVAVIVPLLLFGALHVYQGVAGVVGTTVVGGVLAASYIATGSIVVPILLHALFDLRSLVLIPTAVYGAHRIDGREHKFIARPRAATRTS